MRSPACQVLFPVLLAAGCAGPLTLAAAGDLQLGAARTTDPLADLPSLLAGDVRFVNLEGPLSDRCASEVHGRVDEGRWLRGRVDVVSIANNHRDDCGASGRAETLRALAHAGVHAVDDAPLRLRRARHSIVFFARHYPPDDSLDDPTLLTAIRRERASLVIVSLHWGHTGSLLPTSAQRSFAHALVEAGARVILGHGPHTAMGIERLAAGGHEAVVAYSLGNLAFDCACTEARDAFSLSVRFDARLAIEHLTLRPFRAGLGEPPRVTDDAELRALYQQLSADLDTPLEPLPNGDLVSRHPPGAAAPHQAPSVAGSAR